MKLRGGREVSKGFAPSESTTPRQVKMASKQASRESESVTTQRVLRSAGRLSATTTTPAGTQDSVRTSQPNSASSPTAASSSSSMILRSSSRLDTPSTTVTSRKRKRSDETAEAIAPSKEHERKRQPKRVLAECTICAETKLL